MSKQKKRKSAKDIAKAVQKFLEGKELNENNEDLFNKVLQKAVKPSKS
jgi:hypothetical protein